MRIEVTDTSRNGEVFVRNNTAQRKVEGQLNQILADIEETKTKLKEMLYE